MRWSMLTVLFECCCLLAADVQFPPAPVPAVQPVPADAPVTLRKGQYYVLKADVQQLIFQDGTGSVTIKQHDGAKKALVLPTELVVGWKGDKDDPEFVTFEDKYLYVIKGVTDGTVNLLSIPALNYTDPKGNQIPLKRTDIKRKTLLVETGKGPQPPPVVPPVVPPIVPGGDFKVIMVYESGDTLPAGYNSILYGKVVEEYLDKRCTGGKQGWGRRDKDLAPEADNSPLKALWRDVKPQVTRTPAFAIAVGSKVTLEPFDKEAPDGKGRVVLTPAEAVALLKKYAGDK
jgi:hypothetical protein